MAKLARRACFAAAIIALFATRAASAQSGEAPNDDTQHIRDLYKEGRFVPLADYLKPYIAEHPTDYRSRTILIMALLKSNEQTLAGQEAEALAVHKSDPAAAPYVAQVSALLAELQKQRAAKVTLVQALEQYDVARASQAIADLPGSSTQQAVLKAYLEAYQGKFRDAKTLLGSLKPQRLSEQRAITQIIGRIDDSQKAFEQARAAVDAYLYNEDTSNICNSFMMNEKESRHGKYPYVSGKDLQTYIKNVITLAQTAPLDSDSMDLMFHASLLGREYADVEKLGDRILGAKGSLRIPFLSQTEYFYLVIDSKAKRISTAPDAAHKLQVYYDYPALIATDYTPLGLFHAARGKMHSPIARWYEKEAPFDLSFDDIHGLSQKAKDWRGGLEAKAYAVKFSPSALAPNYLLMNILACVYGEEAQRAATRNLGLYIEHVLQPRKISADLVDPTKHTFDIWGDGHLLSAMGGLYAATAQSAGDAQALQMASLIQSEGAKEEQNSAELRQTQNAGREAWWQAMTSAGFAIGGDQPFSDLEKLAGVL